MLAELESRVRLAEGSADEDAAGSDPSPVGPTLLGVGGALLVAGGVAGVFALVEDGELVGMCPDRVGCDESLRDRYESMRAAALAADILLIGGTLVAATGLLLTLLLRETGGEDSTRAVQCGPQGCGFSGTF